MEEEPCTEAPCACYFTQEDFEKNFGFQGSNPIGWIEKDGELGLTSEDERVEIDDEIEDGVTVHVECNNWCVVMATNVHNFRLVSQNRSLKDEKICLNIRFFFLCRVKSD